MNKGFKQSFFVAVLFFVLAVPVLAAITSPVNPVLASNKYLYVSNTDVNPGVSPNIKVYNTTNTSPSLVTTIGPSVLGNKPSGLALSPDETKLYVGTGTGVKIINTGTWGSILVSGTTFVDTRQLAAAPDGKRLYVVDTQSNAVKVINVEGTNSIWVSTISIGVDGLWGVAVSPDNNWIAVTRRKLASLGGSVYIYSIDHNDTSDVNKITGYTQKYLLISGTDFPSYVSFSNDGDSLNLFVRVDQTTSPYRDVLVYKVDGGFTLAGGINLISASEQDANNKNGEAMTMAANGKFLYLTHYRASENALHAYRITASGRATWAWDSSLDTEFRGTSNPVAVSKDGMAATPDGSKIWFTCSSGGYLLSSLGTGFYDGNNQLTVPVPHAPVITHPASGDALTSYNGNAQWTPGADWPGVTYLYKSYRIDYKEVGTDTWKNVGGDYYQPSNPSQPSLALDPATFVPGHTYILRIRMYGNTANTSNGSVASPYTYSPQFTMGEPTITDIRKTGVVVTSGYIYDSISITGTGFGTRSIPGDSVDGTDYHITFSYWKSYGQFGMWVWETVPSFEGTDARITKWTPTQIEMTIPRKFKSGSLVMPRADYRISVTAYGVSSNSISPFTVGPVITAMQPTHGTAGSTSVRIDGAGFGAQLNTVTFGSGAGAKTATVTSYESQTGSDYLICTVPAALTIGIFPVKVTVNSIDTWSKYQGANPTDVKFTVDNVGGPPTISKLQVKVNGTYQDISDAYIYDSVKIIGTGFGSDPGDGSRDTATNNVKIAGLTVRDDVNTQGLEVYSWKDTEIEFGIPRRVGQTFINAGANSIVVTAPGGTSSSVNLNIKPKIYGISPTSGYAGTTVVTIDGTALEGSRTIYFDANGDAGTGTIVRRNGDDPDGTVSDNLGNDLVTVIVPSSLTTPKEYAVLAKVNSQISNNDFKFTVLEVGAPKILQIIPNAAPNTADITVKVVGENFQPTTTITLKMTGSDIVGVVTYKSQTELSVLLPINGKTAGKWDVVAANGAKTSTLSKGFTILPPGGEISQIIDDFEGVSVTWPGGYTYLPDPGTAILAINTTEKFEGDKSGAVNYALSAGGWREYMGQLAAMQDISNFSSITLMVKGDAANNADARVKVQLGDVNGRTFAAVNLDGTPKQNIPVNLTAWTKYTIPLNNFVEIETSGPNVGKPKVAGAAMNKAGITNYQMVFTGNAAGNNIYADFVAAGGYTPPTSQDATAPQNLRVAKSGNSDVILNWDAPLAGEPADGYQIYTGTTGSNITTKLGAVIPSAAKHEYIHTGAWTDADNHYYLVKAVSGGVESNPSNMAMVEKINLKYNDPAIGNKNWISIPYITDFKTIQDIADNINGGSQPGKCVKISRWNPTTQQFESRTWNDMLSQWDGDFSPIVTGESYEITINADTTVIVAGSHDPNFAFNLTYNDPAIGNKNWISIPYNSSYQNIQEIADSANGAPQPGTCVKISRWNPTTQQFESRTWNDMLSQWDGDLSSIVIGEGFEITISSNLSGWKPSVK